MDTFEQSPETQLGRALFDELLWIHSMIRRDLATVERLAADVMTTLSPAEVQRELKELKTSGRLWQLKVNCLRYCHFVHSHHNLEDSVFFPILRQANPAITPVVDKLEADHRRVSDLLDAVETASAELTSSASDVARKRVAETLNELGRHLLEHLDYEELNAGPTIRRLREL